MMEWIAILLPILLECLDRDDDEAVKRRLMRFPARAYFPARRAFVRDGMTTREAGRAARDVVDALRDANGDDIDELIAEARGQ